MNKNLRNTIIGFVITLLMLFLAFFVFEQRSTFDYVLIGIGALELAYIVYMIATGRGKE